MKKNDGSGIFGFIIFLAILVGAIVLIAPEIERLTREKQARESIARNTSVFDTELDVDIETGAGFLGSDKKTRICPIRITVSRILPKHLRYYEEINIPANEEQSSSLFVIKAAPEVHDLTCRFRIPPTIRVTYYTDNKVLQYGDIDPNPILSDFKPYILAQRWGGFFVPDRDDYQFLEVTYTTELLRDNRPTTRQNIIPFDKNGISNDYYTSVRSSTEEAVQIHNALLMGAEFIPAFRIFSGVKILSRGLRMRGVESSSRAIR